MPLVKECLEAAALNNSLGENISKCLKELEDKEADLLDETSVENIVKILEHSRSNDVLKLVANLARKKENRSALSKEEIFSSIFKDFEESNPSQCLQILRCVANICGENATGAELFEKADGVKIFHKKFTKIVDDPSSEFNDVILPACLCVQNIVSSKDSLVDSFNECDYMDLLWRVAEKHADCEQFVEASVSATALLVDSLSGIEELGKKDIAKKIIKFTESCNEQMQKFIIKELLTDLTKNEKSASLLCKTGCVQLMISLVNKHPSFQHPTCEKDDVMKEMVDLVVVLTAGESSYADVSTGGGSILDSLTAWIDAVNKEVQIAAGLCLGNYARSEASCDELVGKNVHKSLISFINQRIGQEGFEDVFQAYTSCLRNLSVSDSCKRLLVECGAAEMAVELIKKTGLQCQFKALAILRLLVQNQRELAVRLCNDQELIPIVIKLCQVTVVNSTPAEAQRLVAAIMKHSNDEEALQQMLSYEGSLECVSHLMSSDHPLMQNEGLIALILTVANVTGCLQKLKGAGCFENAFKLMKQEGTQAQTLFNSLTLIQATCSIDGGKNVLKDCNVIDTLRKLKEHPEAIISNKADETLRIVDT